MMHRCFAILIAAVLLWTGIAAFPAATSAQQSGDGFAESSASPADSIRVDVIDGGAIYAGGIGGRIIALDAATGNQRWRYQTPGPLAIVHLIDGDTVIGTSHRVKPNSTSLEPVTAVFALDAASGAERWRLTWELETTVVGVAGGRLLLRSVHSPRALVTEADLETSAGLLALDLTTGEDAWLGPIAYHAAVAESDPATLYAVAPVIGEARFDVAALEAETGFERWRAPVGSSVALRILAQDADRLYVATGQVETMLAGGRGRLWAIDRATGAVRWEARTWGRGIAGNDVALWNGLLIAAGSDADGANGAVAAFDAVTGEIVWADAVPGYAHSGATLAGGLALFGNSVPDDPGSLAAEIVARDPATGEPVWRAPAGSVWTGVAATDATNEIAYAIARRSDRDPEQLLALDLATGTVVWQRTIQGSGDVVGLENGLVFVTGDRDTHAVSDLRVYVGDDVLSALDARTGAVRWSRSPA